MSELVSKCSTNKPIGCQWLPAFCIAAAFQRSYDYRYWFYWCFLNFWSSLTCVTAVRCALHQPSLNGLKRVRLQQCCFVLSNDILIPRPPPSPIFFPLFFQSILSHKIHKSPMWILCARKAADRNALSTLRSGPPSGLESSFFCVFIFIYLFFSPHLVRKEKVILL